MLEGNNVQEGGGPPRTARISIRNGTPLVSTDRESSSTVASGAQVRWYGQRRRSKAEKGGGGGVSWKIAPLASRPTSP